MKDRLSPVFVISLILCAFVAIWAVAFDESFSVVANQALSFLSTDFGWLYMIAMTVFMVFVIIIAFSKYGKIKLGPDGFKPEYSTLSWFAMLFGCGMGVGLVFWGIAEPISHFVSPIAAAPETGLFTVLPHYFGGFALCVVILVLLLTFFITSANSGTFVLGMLSSKGDMNPSSSKKILWGALQAAMAIGLLVVGGLKPVQTISIVAAAPFILVMFAVMIATAKALASDPAVAPDTAKGDNLLAEYCRRPFRA